MSKLLMLAFLGPTLLVSKAGEVDFGNSRLVTAVQAAGHACRQQDQSQGVWGFVRDKNTFTVEGRGDRLSEARLLMAADGEAQSEREIRKISTEMSVYIHDGSARNLQIGALETSSVECEGDREDGYQCLGTGAVPFSYEQFTPNPAGVCRS